MHHEGQLLILEPFQLLLKDRLLGTAVGLGSAVVMDTLNDDVLLFFFGVLGCTHFRKLLYTSYFQVKLSAEMAESESLAS